MKYNALLEGLEAVELRLSDVLEDNSKFRFDPEYFKKEYLLKTNKLKDFGYSIIDNMAFVTDGIHESIDFDSNSNINLISAKSPKENIFDLSNNDYISSEQNIKNPRTELKENDVIISTVGTIGNCAVVDKLILPANSDRHVGIVRLNNGFKPHFLSTFLLSKYGRFQTFRESTGNVQLNLFIYKIKTLKIPNFKNIFQSKIETLVKKSHQTLEQSKTLYKQSEEILLKELDLLDFEPTKENIAIKSFSNSFGESGRLDSEYYLPMYDEVIDKIKSYEGGFKQLKYFSESYSTGYPFKSDSYVKNGTYLIRINNIKKGYLDISNASKIPSEDIKLSEKDIAKENDILISMSGTIGNSCKIPKGIEAVINQRIMRITPKNIGFELLPLLINSVIGQNQLERIGTGGVQTNISSSDILSILIPIIDKTIQTQIEEKIKESFRLKEESKRLLEVAKRAVEMAIEEGEELAMEMIKIKGI